MEGLEQEAQPSRAPALTTLFLPLPKSWLLERFHYHPTPHGA